MPFVTRGGVRIHYEVDGEGPALAFVGGLGGNLEVARRAGWVAAFPDYRVVGVDPRGHGRSDGPRDPRMHGIEEYRDDVLAVLDAERLDSVVGWGISDGSLVWAALADAAPGRVSALIDHDGFDDRDLCDEPLRQDRLDYARKVRAQGWAAWIRTRLASGGLTGEPPYLEAFASADSEMVALELEAWTRWKGPVSVLPSLNLPILRFLNGRRDEDEIARIRQQLRGNVELHILPGTSHQQLCLEPAHTVPLMRAFLARVAPRGPPSSAQRAAREPPSRGTRPR